MKIKLIALSAILASPLLALDKATVELSNQGHKSTGGEAPKVKIEISKEWELPTEDKTRALEQKLAFYQLMSAKKVDLLKPITAVYAEQPLADVLKEILPGINVDYNGVDPGVTVKSMKVTKAPLGKVLEYLDNAAGVYFVFSDKGVLVSSKPK
jgi:hypothetical protein